MLTKTMSSKFYTVPLALLILAGCTPEKAAPSTTTGGSAPATTGGTTTGSTPSGTTARREDLPAELKHEAYEYFGLADEKPVDMQVVLSTDATVRTGTVTTTLDEIKDGKAVFSIVRSGNLADLGSQKVSLEKDGVYLISSSEATLEKPQMELPATLSPGKTWSSELKIDQPGRNMQLKTNYRVKGVEKFTTKKGAREGLLVVASGTGTLNGEKITFDSREWYVKGVGGVKAILTTKTAGGKGQTITIEESK